MADAKLTGESALRALPVFLSQILPVGLIGVVAAGMLAAFMSTQDSYLLCWASVLVQDVISPCVPHGLSTRMRLALARLLILSIGVFLLVFGLWYKMERQDLLEYLWITGAIYFTGAFAVLVLGLYWARASKVGAYLALVAGTSSVVGLEPIMNRVGLQGLAEQLGQQRSAAVIGLSCTALAIVMMVAGSLLFPDRAGAAHPREA